MTWNVYEDNAGWLHVEHNGTWYTGYTMYDAAGIAESIRDDDPYDMAPSENPPNTTTADPGIWIVVDSTPIADTTGVGAAGMALIPALTDTSG